MTTWDYPGLQNLIMEIRIPNRFLNQKRRSIANIFKTPVHCYAK